MALLLREKVIYFCFVLITAIWVPRDPCSVSLSEPFTLGCAISVRSLGAVCLCFIWQDRFVLFDAIDVDKSRLDDLCRRQVDRQLIRQDRYFLSLFDAVGGYVRLPRRN
jgi:hypothetical protein